MKVTISVMTVFAGRRYFRRGRDQVFGEPVFVVLLSSPLLFTSSQHGQIGPSVIHLPSSPALCMGGAFPGLGPC